MKQNIRFNLVLIILVVAFALWVLYPLQEKINLGLDLRGGMDLVYEIDVEKMVDVTIERKALNFRGILQENEIYDYSVHEDNTENSIKVTVFDKISSDKEIELEALISEDEYIVKKSGSLKEGLIFKVNESKIRKKNSEALEKALQVIRNRVDMFGVTEPTITTSGGNRIRVQLPGKNSQELAEQIGSTAMLEFKLVRKENGMVGSISQQTNLGKVDEGTEKKYYGKKDIDTGKTPVYILKKETKLTGNDLADARVGRDEFGKPTVDIKFNKEGGMNFARVTKDNVGRQLAIILDDKVISAPVINDVITGGSATISGSFSEQYAKELAIILKAGALPVPLTKVSQISVGPSLGKESIQKGVYAAMIGGILVFLYMLFMYKVSGIVADISLVMNLLLLMAGMALFRATLTLPGIAGIILTIGISVDANVIIFERIKEELRAGKTIGAAIDGGFDKAFSTILDSNVTTIITALILYIFGTGPVKGFAVTLTMGTAINLFTAVFLVRTLFWILTHGLNIKKISI